VPGIKPGTSGSAARNYEHWTTEAVEYKTLSDKMNSRFITGGEVNANHTYWASRLVTTKGRELYKAAADNGCEIISTGKPTYWPTGPKRTRDLTDSFVVKNISTNYIKIREGSDLNSDHTPICLTISVKP
jgi:hypothetical protein